jgi:Putative MetA-pathway of phenol degradation
MNKYFFSTCLFFFLLNTATAQTGAIDPIDTDRPDQTESVNTVPKNWFQFEFGFSRQENERNNYEYLTPTLLSKYGLSNRIELRLITSVFTTSTLLIPAGRVRKTGLDPVEVGAKISLWEEKKGIPKTTFLFHVAIPGFASNTNDINLVAPNLRLTMQNSIAKNFSIGYNIGAEWNGEDHNPAYIYTLSPGFNFAKNWYGYIEIFGAVKKNEFPQHSIDGGFAYNVSNNTKVDISSGIGISNAAPRWYIAVGFSVRFKT